MTAQGEGVLSMLGAALIWGIAPLFFHWLGTQGVGPLEILAHRAIWTLVLFGAVLILRGRGREVALALAPAQLPRMILATGLVTFNWGFFIWGVARGHAVEASLGYYILPLVMSGLALLFLGERPSRAQGLALGLGTLAVIVLAAGLGAAPWLALSLALTFGTYSLIKRQSPTDAITSVTAETLLMLPMALGLVVWLGPDNHILRRDLILPLMALGLVTGIPLILFTHATQKAPLALVGLISYLNPTLQFLCGALVLGGLVTRWHLIALALIWLGLALTSAETLGQRRAERIKIGQGGEKPAE